MFDLAFKYVACSSEHLELAQASSAIFFALAPLPPVLAEAVAGAVVTLATRSLVFALPRRHCGDSDSRII